MSINIFDKSYLQKKVDSFVPIYDKKGALKELKRQYKIDKFLIHCLSRIDYYARFGKKHCSFYLNEKWKDILLDSVIHNNFQISAYKTSYEFCFYEVVVYW